MPTIAQGSDEMESKIDWSKAPEDATHHITENNSTFECWLKPGYAVRVSRGSSDWVRNDYADKLIADCATARPSTPSWSGEGLPPVGVVCEALYMGQPQGVVTVRYSGQCMILWSEDRMSEQCGQADHYFFKPIRTQEQIAADAREAAVNDMHAIYMKGAVHGGGLYAIYDAGYRKP